MYSYYLPLYSNYLALYMYYLARFWVHITWQDSGYILVGKVLGRYYLTRLWVHIRYKTRTRIKHSSVNICL